jgi:ribonuclease HI
MAKKNYYAVRKGRKTGIFKAWYGEDGAEVQVKGFAGAEYMGFPDRRGAEKWLNGESPARSRYGRQGGSLVFNEASGTYEIDSDDDFTGQDGFPPQPESRAMQGWADLDSSPSRTGSPANAEPSTPSTHAPPGPNPGQRAPGWQVSHAPGAVVIYTDGGCSRNPGPGGYGAVILFPDGQRIELSGGFSHTTNNRMELTACIKALEHILEGGTVEVYSDSRYVVNGMMKNWAKNWRSKGWMKNETEPALNPDLWEKLLNLCEKRTVEFKWLPGHEGITENERCDQLTHEARGRKDLPVDEGYKAGFSPFENALHGVFVPPIEQAPGLFPGINTDVEREEDDRP